MTPEQAEEFTQSLEQIVAGGWRQTALAERLGVPETLGMTTREWVERRLGGYLKLNVIERREAVVELTSEGMTQRQVAGVLGVDQATVHRDANASLETPATIDDLPGTETVCPTCHGSGRVLLIEGGQQ